MANLNFLNTDDCDAITFNTPMVGFKLIDYMTQVSAVRSVANVERYSITHSVNCCSPGITTIVAPKYNFQVSSSCVYEAFFPEADAYNFTISGINPNLVQSATFASSGSIQSYPWIASGTTGISFTDVGTPGSIVGPLPIIITIITKAGFKYIVRFTLTKYGGACDGTVTLGLITYPVLPSNVALSPSALVDRELNFNLLIGQTLVQPGVYEVIFCEHYLDGSSLCIQNYAFIDCGTLKCQVVNKWVQCIDSNIMDFYNGLVWSNDCTTTITFAEVCAIYEILTIILQSDNCYGMLDDCNCSDAQTVANKLYPVRHPAQTNPNSCSTC